MDDLRVGTSIRVIRIRRRMRQEDVALAAGVSRATVSRAERGHVGSISLDTLRSVCASLDIRVDLVPRWRGGDLERVVNARHAAMHEAIARAFRDRAGWTVQPEVSFSQFGERGVIDLLAWHADRRSLLIVELKTELVDINDLMATMDRRRRLAPAIGQARQWVPASVGVWVVMAGTMTNRRRLAEHSTVLRAAFPAARPAMSRWLLDPVGPIAGLTFLSGAHQRNVGEPIGAIRRVTRARSASGVPEVSG
ncbi:MAG: helix-turn-helix transcriptional regulator [Chloroflexi bacterium]|nr:helix-turn-helix transcriptional regulator [Chloroflexota bacterium]